MSKSNIQDTGYSYLKDSSQEFLTHYYDTIQKSIERQSFYNQWKKFDPNV